MLFGPFLILFKEYFSNVTNIGREIADVREIASFSARRFFPDFCLIFFRFIPRYCRFFRGNLFPIYCRFFPNLSRDIPDFFPIFSKAEIEYFCIFLSLPIYCRCLPIYCRDIPKRCFLDPADFFAAPMFATMVYMLTLV